MLTLCFSVKRLGVLEGLPHFRLVLYCHAIVFPYAFGYAMQSLLFLLTAVIELYIWVVLIQVILSWLVAFNVINMRNQFVYTLGNMFHRLTEPVLQPIRRFLPNLGGIDISPVILILLLYFMQSLLHEYWPGHRSG